MQIHYRDVTPVFITMILHDASALIQKGRQQVQVQRKKGSVQAGSAE